MCLQKTFPAFFQLCSISLVSVMLMSVISCGSAAALADDDNLTLPVIPPIVPSPGVARVFPALASQTHGYTISTTGTLYTAGGTGGGSKYSAFDNNSGTLTCWDSNGTAKVEWNDDELFPLCLPPVNRIRIVRGVLNWNGITRISLHGAVSWTDVGGSLSFPEGAHELVITVPAQNITGIEVAVSKSADGVRPRLTEIIAEYVQ